MSGFCHEFLFTYRRGELEKKEKRREKEKRRREKEKEKRKKLIKLFS
jgi:hypothetical protein